MEFTSERHYLEFIRANYKYLFAHLLDQSQYNRRSRHLAPILDLLRLARACLENIGSIHQPEAYTSHYNHA